MNIAKGKIGNALTSTADNHVVAVANDIYDEEREKYQSEINENSVIGKDDEGNEVYPGNVHSFTDDSKYIYVKCDAEYHILWAIKADGTIYYGVGIPPQVQDAINKAVEYLQIDITGQLDDLDRIINEHLDDIETRIPQDSDNPEFIQVTLDEEGRIIEGIRPDGTKYIAQLESPTLDGVKKEISENIQPQLDELSKKIAENVFAIEMDDEGNLVAIIDEDSNVTDVGITDDGDIYADFNIE